MISTIRQAGILGQEKLDGVKVCVVGCGAIGSHTAETMAKVGIRKMSLWDFDTVEDHNLSNQGYYLTDLGKNKVDALSDRLMKGTGVKVTKNHKRFEDDSDTGSSQVLISAVDNMQTRRVLWDKFVGNQNIKLFIDGRMAARFGQVFTIDRSLTAMELYEESLFSDAEAYQAPCTEKSTIFCAYGMASLISAQLFNWLKEGKAKSQVEVDFRNMALYQVN